jgi:hypothetical protein
METEKEERAKAAHALPHELKPDGLRRAKALLMSGKVRAGGHVCSPAFAVVCTRWGQIWGSVRPVGSESTDHGSAYRIRLSPFTDVGGCP